MCICMPPMHGPIGAVGQADPVRVELPEGAACRQRGTGFFARAAYPVLSRGRARSRPRPRCRAGCSPTCARRIRRATARAAWRSGSEPPTGPPPDAMERRFERGRPRRTLISSTTAQTLAIWNRAPSSFLCATHAQSTKVDAACSSSLNSPKDGAPATPREARPSGANRPYLTPASPHDVPEAAAARPWPGWTAPDRATGPLVGGSGHRPEIRRRGYDCRRVTARMAMSS